LSLDSKQIPNCIFKLTLIHGWSNHKDKKNQKQNAQETQPNPNKSLDDVKKMKKIWCNASWRMRLFHSPPMSDAPICCVVNQWKSKANHPLVNKICLLFLLFSYSYFFFINFINFYSLCLVIFFWNYNYWFAAHSHILFLRIYPSIALSNYKNDTAFWEVSGTLKSGLKDQGKKRKLHCLLL